VALDTVSDVGGTVAGGLAGARPCRVEGVRLTHDDAMARIFMLVRSRPGRTTSGTRSRRRGSTPVSRPRQVAEWAGHSVHVLPRVYAKCILGQEEAARRRIEAALRDEAEDDGGRGAPGRAA
jgi:hypothetical protein